MRCFKVTSERSIYPGWFPWYRLEMTETMLA